MPHFAGGVCCIDEFDGIKEADKVSIHEVMEQQTLSIAKAGLITTLTTRTSIFGSMNPKGNPRDSIAEQTGLSGPLLSRFDMLLPVHDTKNAEQDEMVSRHILNNHQGHQEPAEQVYYILVYLYAFIRMHVICPIIHDNVILGTSKPNA